MREAIKKGLGFGLTSGIITTLGLIIGLYSSTSSKLAIIGGIIIIAVADSLSDALGIHISEEFNHKNSKKHVWESTFATFLFKFIFAITFIIPFLLLSILTAIIASIVWGLFLITAFSYYITKMKNKNVYKICLEHLSITILVIIASYYIGIMVKNIFGI